jgi:hypothetical protein
MHNEFVPPDQIHTGRLYVQIFVVVATCSSEEATRTVVSVPQYRTEPHVTCCAEIPRLERNIPIITQPPQSPDLVLSDFWLFPTLKMGLNRALFVTMEDTKSNGTAKLRKIPK